MALALAYSAAFSSAGWVVNRVDAIEAAMAEEGLVIADFFLAARAPAKAVALPCAQLALDIHYRAEYLADPMAHPFHLLDNAMAIVHDQETASFIRNVVRPVNCLLTHIPYPAQGASTLTKAAPRRIYLPAASARHPWVEETGALPVQAPFPAEAPEGSFLIVPEYAPEAWAAVNWAMATGLPAILPGTQSFQRTCFYGALLFDPASEDDFRAKIAIMDRPAAKKPAGRSLRVAVVTPRHELQTAGGAENHAARLAESLAGAGHIAEILTTRTSSMLEWKNDLPDGAQQMEGMTVRRFPLDNLDGTEHHRLGHMINSLADLTWTEQTEWMRRGFRSTALDDYIAANAENYDYLFFIPYLYGTAYWASQKAPEKSLLIPCYHREPAAFVKVLNQNAQWMAGILFNTAAEMKLAREELKIHNPNMMVVGEGVDTHAKGGAARFRAKHGLQGDFILYVGRFQKEKGLADLIDQWKEYVRSVGSKVTLAIAGRGDMKVTDDPAHNIRLLGFLPEEEKLDALTACSALALPSTRESFSIVMMESWIAGRPVIANARCDAAREHIFSCRGGLLYDGAGELAACVERIANGQPAADAMGQRGRDYAIANFQWPKIVEGIVAALEGMSRAPLTQRLGQAMAAAGGQMEQVRANAMARFLAEVEEKISRATPLAEESIPELLRKVEDLSDTGVNYSDFTHRKALGGVWSAIRGAITRHMRVNYLDIMAGKQRSFNRETASLLRRIYDRLRDGD